MVERRGAVNTLGRDGCNEDIIVSSSCRLCSRGVLEEKIWEIEWRSMDRGLVL